MHTVKGKEFSTICRLAAKVVQSYRMIDAGDRILVGLSGGKDSLTLMHVLQQLRRRSPVKFELIGATFDPGFPGLEVAMLAAYCQAQGWEHRVIACPVERLVRERDLGEQPCSFCARLRRGYLYRLGEELECNKLALGQHLDDLCASLLLSLFRGGGIRTMGPNVPADSGKMRVIRPLCHVTEAAIRQVAAQSAYPDFGRCGYEEQVDLTGDRAFLEHLIDSLGERFGNIRKHLLHSMGDLRPGHLLDLRFLPPAAGGGDPRLASLQAAGTDAADDLQSIFSNHHEPQP
jgi:tRNA 2-thiocytidine biosynthesis protein TtcA